MAIAADTYDEPVERRPGDFARNHQGAPWVTSPTKTRKRKGNKAELITLCAAAGITVPDKVTVAQLYELLGPEPARVMYGRPSSLGKQIENQSALQKWSERAVALGVFLAPELLRPLVDLDHDQLNLDDAAARALLDEVAVKGKNAAQAGIAAERGTHTHELTEDLDTDRDPIERMKAGEDLGIPFNVQHALVAAWERTMFERDFETLAVEAAVVDDVWRQAGTLDRIVRLRRDITFVTATAELVTITAGTVLVLDIKTGRLRLDNAGFVSYWHGYAVQCASYAQATPYDVDTDTRSAWPFEIDQRWAIVAHLDVLTAITEGKARCRLIAVDLAAGREAGERCVWARQWERRTDVFTLPTDDLMVEIPVEEIAEEVPVPVTTSSAPAAAEEDRPPATSSAAPPDEEDVHGVHGDDAVEHNALALANRPSSWADADRQTLAAAWPTDLPTPGAIRRGDTTWTDAQCERAAALIDSIDPFAQQIPIPPIDPPTAAPVDRDEPAADGEVEAFMAEIAASGDTVKWQMNAWLAEAKTADVFWHPKIVRTARSVAIARVAHHLAVLFAGDDDCNRYCEAVLDFHRPDDGPIGVRLGLCDHTAATEVLDICTQIAGPGPARLLFTDQGAPYIGTQVESHAATAA